MTLANNPNAAANLAAPLDTGVLAALAHVFDPATLLMGNDIPARHEKDWSVLPPVRPLAVLRPKDTEGIATAMRLCAEHGVPVVPQGGLTGLCGGACPLPGSVALSLERMTGIEEIDAATASMTVRAGTPLEAVQRAADEAGFLFPLDLGARGSCFIGGNLATNAGGNRVIRYGMARDMVLGLEVVLPDGTVLNGLNKMLKNNAGCDLKHMFIGSEGIFGVITRAVLKLFPKPAATMAALCALPDYEATLRLLGAARQRLGPLLSAFEVMWPDYWAVMTERMPGMRRPFREKHGIYVLIEAQGTDPDADPSRFETWLEGLAGQDILSDAVMAQSLADVQAFWALRDAVSEFYQVLGPHLSFDIGLPVGDMDHYASMCRMALKERLPECQALFFGHIGDGNMHIVVSLPGLQPKEEIESIIYGMVRKFGGTVSAEHGIGTLKKPWLAYARKPEEIAMMRTLKAAIDPKNILNPGKIL